MSDLSDYNFKDIARAHQLSLHYADIALMPVGQITDL